MKACFKSMDLGIYTEVLKSLDVKCHHRQAFEFIGYEYILELEFVILLLILPKTKLTENYTKFNQFSQKVKRKLFVRLYLALSNFFVDFA